MSTLQTIATVLCGLGAWSATLLAAYTKGRADEATAAREDLEAATGEQWRD